jgi:hypothetical protein
MLSHKRLNEVIASHTYFANEKSIEVYDCVQEFLGMTSKILYVAGMKFESEFVCRFSLSARTKIQNIIPKFDGLFDKEFKSINTPMSEG